MAVFSRAGNIFLTLLLLNFFLTPVLVGADEASVLNLSKYRRKKGKILEAPRHTTDADLPQLKDPRFNKLKELLLVDTQITDWS